MNTNLTFTRSILGRSLAVAVLGLAALAATPARADDVPTHVVSYADLDLSRPAGAERLLVRLQTAAATVCGHASSQDYRAKLRIQLCREQAIARAVANVNVPAFSSWYASRTTRTSPDGILASAR
jgi:UrcA family protein